MNLLDIRKKFVELSGREDLKNSDNTDNGADYFINSASKWLDEQLDNEKAVGRNYRLVDPKQFIIPIKECRVIHEVWATEVVNPKWKKLNRRDLDFFKRRVNSIARADKGIPTDYVPTNLRTSPSTDRPQDPDFFNSIADLSDYISDAHYPYQGILLWPFPRKQMQVEIKGMFYQDALINDDDTNFWANQHPNLLIDAALRQLESSYRNTQGVKDWENVIHIKLVNIDKDSVAESNVDIFELGG